MEVEVSDATRVRIMLEATSDAMSQFGCHSLPLRAGDTVRVSKLGSSYNEVDGIVKETFVEGSVEYAAVQHVNGHVREYDVAFLRRTNNG